MFEVIIILGIEVLTTIFVFIKLIQSIAEMDKDVRRLN
ncbi:hypothetical protein LCGC14_3114180 [marine sediment metagenome]|uniref:Uncharacterized protein n=1 Tax=marine sediment metagenome TaxID=412755 RepID=A0A0F8WT70_9ZZZZ